MRNERIADKIFWAAKIAIRATTMWPALMFAARRKERVMGRTETLEDSIRTRNGLSQDGAPPGRSIAINFIGLDRRAERINLSQSVSPKEKVKVRCLDSLKVYGVRPARLQRMRRRNNVLIVGLQPISRRERDKVSWGTM